MPHRDAATREGPHPTPDVTLAAPSSPPKVSGTPISLEGLRRLSPCCRSGVFHPDPPPRFTLALLCCHCHRPVESFIVENSAGVQIWPLPPGIRASKVRIRFCATPRFRLHVALPARFR